MSTLYRYLLIVSTLFFMTLVTGCNNSADEQSVGNNKSSSKSQIKESTTQSEIVTHADPLDYSEFGLPTLTDSEFNALTSEQKYQVAIKLYATLYYGISYSQLTDRIESGTFIAQTRVMFDLPNDPADLANVEAQIVNYHGWGDGNITSPMLARLYHLPPGREYFNRWAAYVLAQTIMFSPAYELNTVFTEDVVTVYNRLNDDMAAEYSMQQITYRHMITGQNWRRFRSPEDNGREMLEIFLMDFNDSHVPLAAKALQNWELNPYTKELIIKPDNENTEPITDLFEGITIYNGYDFYSALVNQPDFLPTVSRRLVDVYFPNHSEQQKENIVTLIVSSEPTSWQGLLKQIVYSKEYLLNSARTRSYEETFYPLVKTLDWHAHEYSFMITHASLNGMHQATMQYKLGRKTEVPLDTQAFAWFHKTVREHVMINIEQNTTFESWDDGWGLEKIFETIPESITTKEEAADHMIETLFFSTLGRNAYTEEYQFFHDMINADKYDPDTFENFWWVSLLDGDDPQTARIHRGYYANMVLDYISRLSALYTFDAIQTGGQ